LPLWEGEDCNTEKYTTPTDIKLVGDASVFENVVGAKASDDAFSLRFTQFYRERVCAHYHVPLPQLIVAGVCQ
jgi:hypothetical protein